MSAMLLRYPFALAIVAAAVSVLVIMLRLRFAGRGLDLPGHRSLHSRPTPHGGGVGIVTATLACGLLVGAGMQWLVVILVLAMISLADDWLDIPFWVRLLVHLACAAGLVYSFGVPSLAMALFIMLVIAWSTNAYNFMDGADGLAGSMAVTGFAVYAVAFQSGGYSAQAGLCAALAGSALGFLYFNWHPARIFMGDVGSIPLGFLAGGLGWHGFVLGAWPAWFGPLVFAPFLLDASVTLIRRVARGERIWLAHRDHYYQRMVRAGMTHAAMCSRWLLTMFLGGILALLLLMFAESLAWVAVALWSIFLLFLGWRIDAQWVRYCRAGSLQ
jgi:UDP-N-acetylmuramyl pentapeptide phosphotransferase/UDP-N-acetylglucosamine-1-phosphate transferase